MTTPRVVTVVPAYGVVAPVPWMSRIATVSAGAPGPGSLGASSVGSGEGVDPEDCGVTVVALVKSAELSPVSVKSVRTRELGVPFGPSTTAGAASNETAPPYPRKSTTRGSSTSPAGRASDSATFARKSWPVVPDGFSPLVRSGPGRSAPVVPFPGRPIR